MRILEILRNKAFWGIDALKGGVLKRYVTEIEKSVILGGNLSETHLDSILKYATTHVEFYKQFAGFKSLTDFPVINKNVVRDNEDMFIAEGFDKLTLFKQETSGSTGMPFVVYQDPGKRKRATADTLVFSKLANYELGARLYFSRVWVGVSRKSKLSCLVQNWVTHDASSLSDDSIRELLEMWEKDSSTKNVLIFASSLTLIAKYIVRNGFKPRARIESFITLSEALDPWTKETIQRVYNTNVFSRYSDQELGIMAQQLPGSSEFVVNTGSFYFEILDMEEDVPVEEGKQGRIVVTDLFNRSMPLIRYDTGDVAVVKPGSRKDGKLIFESIGGRRVDCILNTRGETLSPYVINNPMHEFLDIQQYQFIQEGEKDYKLLVNLKDGVEFEKEQEVVDTLKSYLGADANVQIEYVKAIPVMKSGKVKSIINKYKTV